MWRRRRFCLDLPESSLQPFETHVARLDAALGAPGLEQAGIAESDVVIAREAEIFGGLIDPARGAFELDEDANRGLIESNHPCNDARLAAARELGAVFFVAERGFEAESPENGQALVEIAGAEFAFLAAFVNPGNFFALEGDGDVLAGGPNPQQEIAGFDGALRIVENDVLLEDSGVEYAEAAVSQQGSGFGGARHSDFDLDFFGLLQDLRIAAAIMFLRARSAIG